MLSLAVKKKKKPHSHFRSRKEMIWMPDCYGVSFKSPVFQKQARSGIPFTAVELVKYFVCKGTKIDV